MSATCIDQPVDIKTLPESEFTISLDKQLLIDSREFAADQRVKSWWHLVSTLTVLLACTLIAWLTPMIWVRALGSFLMGLVIVRMFIIYHDHQHGAIFKDSKLANAILCMYGFFVLTPPSVWRRSHNHHHKNNSKLFGASIGSFPIMTTEDYRNATWAQKLEYRIARSPLVIMFGYVTVFLFGMCLRPLLMDPRQHLDAPVALVVHFGFLAACWWLCGWQTALFVFVLPTWVAMISGAYLFYVQHNFPGAKIRDDEEWTYVGAALHSSSYLEMGPILNWLTGNIGYHHVHHLNAKIPFYRLPETMRAFLALQKPTRISLSVRDIVRCLRLKLWDVSKDRFVTFSEAKKTA